MKGRKTERPAARDIGMLIRNLAARRVARLCYRQHIQETSKTCCRWKKARCILHCSACCARAGLAADWGISARNRKVRTYKLTPAGRKQLDRDIAGFERLLAGIGRVMRPVES